MNTISFSLKRVISFFCFFAFILINAQVGIGNTNPNQDALLDVGTDNSSAGIRLPRVALTGLNTPAPLTAHVYGMIVYNTATAGTGSNIVRPGFYYNNGTTWVKLAQDDNWRISGNAGTSPTTNFLGTTDNVSLNFKTNNIDRLIIQDTGQVGINGSATSPDFFSVTSSSINSYAINGYCSSAPLGGGLYGYVTNNANTKAAVWADTESTDSNASAILGQYIQSTGSGNGIYGFTNSTSGVGVRGYKPSGGTGWGGVFYNDLGYTGFFGTASDKRLKTNLKPLRNSISVINKLKVYSYQFNIKKYPNLGDSMIHFGVIAQELEDVLPNLVRTKNIDLYNTKVNERDKEMHYKEVEKIKTVNYIELIPVLINAVKEQQKIMENQQKQLDVLKKTILELEKRK